MASNFSLSLLIGLRYHRVKHNNGFVSFISASSTIGIALGVAVLIIGLSVMNGFERELLNRYLSLAPHGEIESPNPPLLGSEQLQRELEQRPGIEATAPFINLSALAQHGKKMQAIAVRGVDPLQEQQVSSIRDYVSEIDWQAFTEQKGLLLGGGISDKLGIETGDWITLLLPNVGGEAKSSFSAAKRHRIQVSGIFRVQGMLDQSLAYIPITTARELLNWPSGEHGIRIQVADPLNAEDIIWDAARYVSQRVYVRSWMRSQGYLYQDIQLVKTLMYAIMMLIVAVASFNIISTLILAVSDKRPDIAILMTMGAQNKLLLQTFIVYGAYNGVVGSLIGLVFGVLGSLFLPQIANLTADILGHTLLSSEVYFINFLPSELMWSDVAVVLCVALSMSILATIWPALRATKIHAAQALA
ncbi:lipoprotein-releasing ABC transporter permease subunit LolE [Alginatibacterium sediminis]|uniref:Lipoprotein-releasing ABC transporter permease subunit LolE n=1 Tax=Alginatibacterium sediminis TaxID=2164068 RepID=A0A420EFT1_9ALTE|nr:lipoprotein-releasing ABC transporter permease subunit LolE [Alginatibacterium sediminis]RKF19547.1 lipoprotein-releasing ABC transporter permease subunit LolE [Alginatibacterium sediminis]